MDNNKPKVAVIMGSASDFDVVERCVDLLEEFRVDCELRVISAHRTPHEAADFAAGAEENGFDVIIAAAGKAAHLAGVIAGHTPLPVIGIPIKTSLMGGLDSLLSVVQMPKGVPVATVAVDGAENAALLAVQMLSLKYESCREDFKEYKKKMHDEVCAADASFNK